MAVDLVFIHLNGNCSESVYMTNSSRRWVIDCPASLRDRVPQQERWIKEGLVFKTTSNIIKAAHSGKLPPQIMITIHPQRWSSSVLPWVKELVLQNLKNLINRVFAATNR